MAQPAVVSTPPDAAFLHEEAPPPGVAARYSRRQRLGIGLVLAQLALVAVGAGGIGLDSLGAPGAPLNYYAVASGAAFTYGFFSPGIVAQLDAYFDVSFPDGTQRTVTLDSDMSREGSLRVGDIIDAFVNGEETHDDAKLGRALSASLAATIFGRYPEATKVVVRLERTLPVTMIGYRAGERMRVEKVYRAVYAAPDRHDAAERSHS